MRLFLMRSFVGVIATSSLVLAQTMPTPPPPRELPRSPIRQEAETPLEYLQTFQPNDVRIEWNNRHWQLVTPQGVLKDFGTQEGEARQAARLIHDLRLTEHVVIGSPQPILEYWLSNGKAPYGAIQSGMRSLMLNPGNVRIERVDGQWHIRDGARVLLNCGQQGQDAQQALAAIKKYHFDQVGIVGQAAPSMYVFMTRTPETKGKLPVSRSMNGTTRSMATPHFSRLAKNADGKPKFEQSKATPKMSGLEGVTTALLPPLADRSVASEQAKKRDFQWKTQSQFHGQPTVPASGDRVVFDWRQVQLKQDNGDWKLMAGSTPLASFGNKATEARIALQAMRHYRFTEQVRLGGPDTYLTYYVPHRASPRGLMIGMQGEALDVPKLEVRHVDTGYAICQGTKIVLRLRDREEDGRKLLETMIANKCDRIAQIGEPGKEGMTILVRAKSENTSGNK
jgi:hypothetical protein